MNDVGEAKELEGHNDMADDLKDPEPPQNKCLETTHSQSPKKLSGHDHNEPNLDAENDGEVIPQENEVMGQDRKMAAKPSTQEKSMRTIGEGGNLERDGMEDKKISTDLSDHNIEQEEEAKPAATLPKTTEDNDSEHCENDEMGDDTKRESRARGNRQDEGLASLKVAASRGTREATLAANSDLGGELAEMQASLKRSTRDPLRVSVLGMDDITDLQNFLSNNYIDGDDTSSSCSKQPRKNGSAKNEKRARGLSSSTTQLERDIKRILDPNRASVLTSAAQVDVPDRRTVRSISSGGDGEESQPGAYYETGRGPGQIPVWHRQRIQEQQQLQRHGGPYSFTRHRSCEPVPLAIEVCVVPTDGSDKPGSVQEATAATLVIPDKIVSEEETKVKRRRKQLAVGGVFLVLLSVILVLVTQVQNGKENRNTTLLHSFPTNETLSYDQLCVMPDSIELKSPLAQCLCGATDLEGSLDIPKIENFLEITADLVHDGVISQQPAKTMCNQSTAVAIWWLVESDQDDHFSTEKIERFALVSLFSALNGIFWTNRNSWLTARSACDWHGIECDSENNVVGIALQDNDLKGTLPPEIGLLSTLKRVDFDDNGITGQIPAEFLALDQLESLSIENNPSLAGEVDIGKLISLEELSVRGSLINGSVLACDFGNVTSRLKMALDCNSTACECCEFCR